MNEYNLPETFFFLTVAGIGEICFVYSVLTGAVKSSVKHVVMSAKIKNIILKHLLNVTYNIGNYTFIG